MLLAIVQKSVYIFCFGFSRDFMPRSSVFPKSLFEVFLALVGLTANDKIDRKIDRLIYYS